LTVTSPSNIELIANTDVIFELVYQSQTVGSVIIPKIALKPGENAYVAKSFVRPDPNNAEAVKATRALLSAFTGGQDTQVTVTKAKSSNMPSLDNAFGSLTLLNTLPSSKKPLIDTARFTFPNLFTFKSRAGLTAMNPFASAVEIVRIKSTLSYKNGVIGTIDQAVSNFRIEPKGSARSPALTLNIKLDLKSIQALLAAFGNGLQIVADSTLTVSFGGYQATIDYKQSGVPTSLVFNQNNV
jgi:hypothetical protein